MVWRNCIVMLGCKGLTGLSFISLLLTMSKLELLLGDMKMMAMEIEEYHTFLAQMSTFGVSELFFLLLSLAYGFCFSAMHRYPRNIKQWLTRNERTLNLQMLNSLCKIHA